MTQLLIPWNSGVNHRCPTIGLTEDTATDPLEQWCPTIGLTEDTATDPLEQWCQPLLLYIATCFSPRLREKLRLLVLDQA